MTNPIRQAVVLAGGKGTRLGSLTADRPKPLLPVAGRPFIEWVEQNLRRQGITEIIYSVGYRADAFQTWLKERKDASGLSLFVEETPLDTGGALCELSDTLDETFFVLNGDTLFDVSLDALRTELDREGCDAAIALRSVEDVDRFGQVTLGDGVVESFAEKSGSGPGLVNGGVYALRRRVLASKRAPMSIETELLPELVRGRRVRGVPASGFFIDIGLPATYAEAQRSVPAWWGRRADEQT